MEMCFAILCLNSTEHLIGESESSIGKRKRTRAMSQVLFLI